MKQVNKIQVQLASNEYGSGLMEKIAIEVGYHLADKWPLIVVVSEHGGWWLSYWFAEGFMYGGIIIDTANDLAKFNEHQEAIRTEIGKASIKYLPSIRR